MGEPPITNPSKGLTSVDVEGISSLVRIYGTIIALARRAQGRNIRVLVDSGSIDNYISV